jgi:hypothetical protein
VINTGEEFVVKGPGGSGPATFIFAGPSGAITGWNTEADPDDAISAFVKGADLKGLALAQTNRGPMLLAADFANNRVHAFDGDFDRIQTGRDAFRDPGMPADYAPFNVESAGLRPAESWKSMRDSLPGSGHPRARGSQRRWKGGPGAQPGGELLPLKSKSAQVRNR